MRIFITFIVSIFMFSCASVQQTNGAKDLESFVHLIPNQDNKEKVKNDFGTPKEISTSDTKSEKIEQWTYAQNGIPKIWVVFNNDLLQSVTMSVWENDEASNVDLATKKFSAKWQIQPKVVSNPHSMPTKCYLVDEKQGLKLEIHGYKKIVESISRWNPAAVNKKQKNKPAEVCVANHCAKSKQNGNWKSSYCEWLNAYIK